MNYVEKEIKTCQKRRKNYFCKNQTCQKRL